MWKEGETPFLGWYVNLQDRFWRVNDGIVTWDRSLDIRVTPDLQWSWKDEDHFACIQALGWITPEEAMADQNWVIPDLPKNWATLPTS